jgi:hypothetical protein
MGDSGGTPAGRRKGRWIAVAVVAVVAAGAGGWLGLRGPDYHERLTRGRGPVPAALGTGAPAAPDRTLRRLHDSYGVLGGLSLSPVNDADGDQEGVAARSVRTGRTYWTYRRNVAVAELAADKSTLVVWWKDGVIAALDPGTGRTRWHAREKYGDATGDDDPGLSVADGLVVTVRADGLTARAEGNGHRVWRAGAPKGCTLDPQGVIGLRGVVTVHAECPDDAGWRYAYDTRTGAVRWRENEGPGTLLRAGDTTLAASAWKDEGRGRTRGAVLDTGVRGGSRPVVTTSRVLRDVQPSVAAGSGILLCVDNTSDDKHGALIARGLTDLGVRWRRGPAHGTEFGNPLVAGGRVYVVQQPLPANAITPGKGTARLLTLDAATGRLLHTTALPALPLDEATKDVGIHPALAPVQAIDGVVTVGWGGGGLFSAQTEDLLVVS